jgi:hypothetical protein
MFNFYINEKYITFEKIEIGFLLVWFSGLIFVGIINLFHAIKLYKNNEIKLLLNLSKRLKILIIPFWIINFFAWALIIFGLVFALRGGTGLIIGAFILIIGISFSYIVLLLTSTYSIFFIKSLYKIKIIKNHVLHIILQLCFILDIVDILWLNKKYKEII